MGNRSNIPDNPNPSPPPPPKRGALYRAQLSCRIGRDVLVGKADTPSGVPRVAWALYQLFHALEDIAEAMEEMQK